MSISEYSTLASLNSPPNLNRATTGRWAETSLDTVRSLPEYSSMWHEMASSLARSGDTRKWSYRFPAWVVPTPTCPDDSRCDADEVAGTV